MNTNKELDVYDSLLIRAIRCKKNPSYNILKRVWARYCRINVEYVDKACITNALLELINDYKLISITAFAYKLNPGEAMFYRNMDKTVKGYEYNNHVLNVCCSIIRTCPPEKLVGFRVPTIFKRKII